MTAHVHDPATTPVDDAGDGPVGSSSREMSTRPRWLMPGIAVGVVVAGLVLAGVISLSTALYGAMFGGMLLMHLGGHGMHGAHGGGGHGGHRSGGSSGGRASSEPQRMSQPDEPGSAADESGDRGPDDGPGIEAPQHDQRGSHGCH